MEIRWEPIGGGLSVPVNEQCRFSADALLLAKFAAPLESDTVCDLGSGNGIIPLLWCRRHPPRHITAVEREPLFAEMVGQAVARFSLEDRIRVCCADWSDSSAMPQAASMTLVTCNPPYFPFGAARKNPDTLRAAARHEDSPELLDGLCRCAKRLLIPNGRFCLCHRPERLTDVLSAVRSAGMTPRKLQFVHQNETADAWLILLEAGFSGTLRVLPPLIQQPLGAHTDVYKRLYR